MSNPHTSAVPGEGIDLIGGNNGGVPSAGPHGCRTGSSALRISLAASQGLVTTSHALASMVGNRILLQGGNAMDATAAIIATLNVVEPMSSSIAGNGFITLYDNTKQQVHALNMVGPSPLELPSTIQSISEHDLAQGPKAAVVPGIMGGICDLLVKFGTMTITETFEYAIQYATHGHPICEAHLAAIHAQTSTLSKYPTSTKVFLQSSLSTHDIPQRVGEMVYNPDLARTFQTLCHAEQTAIATMEDNDNTIDNKEARRIQGIQAACDCFYKGSIAQEYIQWFQDHDGFLTLQDLQTYRDTMVHGAWEEPIHTTYRGYDIYTNGNTSRGGVETLMNLNVLEGLVNPLELQKDPMNNPQVLHAMAETIKIVKSCVYQHLGDPKLYNIPYTQMLSKDYAKTLQDAISMDTARNVTPATPPDLGVPLVEKKNKKITQKTSCTVSSSSTVASTTTTNSTDKDTSNKNDKTTTTSSQRTEDYYDSPDTTSFSVIDKWGNCVCCTITIGEGFGTRCVAGNTGLLFNNGIRIGSTSPYPSSINYLQPQTVPLINNAPILVLQNQQLKLALGTPGGEAIGQVQTQALVNILDYKMSIQEAIEYPRFKLIAKPNFYVPDAQLSLHMEQRYPDDTIETLEQTLGHYSIRRLGPYSICAVQGIVVGSLGSTEEDEEDDKYEHEKKSDMENDTNDEKKEKQIRSKTQYGNTAGADPRGGYYAVGY
mmetsp:Transcript_705/g.1021  ORF Transcript_705/g.1021 Transcript_705/m.1021 type:complete len:713 (-) Transcript_705:59-2197(-)